MRATMIAAVGALALAGCQTTRIDTAIDRSLPELCDAATAAHTAFLLVSATGRVPDNVTRTESAAWDSLRPVCAEPDRQTTGTLLVNAARAYVTITAALDKAE